MRKTILLLSVLSVTASLSADVQNDPGTSLAEAFRDFWQADGPEQAALAADAIIATGADFDEVLARLEAGRPYSPQVKTGRVDLMNRTSVGAHPTDPRDAS